MRAFSYLVGPVALFPPVAAPPLATLMAETAPPEHTSTGEMEPNDAPELFPVPSPETLFDDSTVDAVPMEMTDTLSPADESEMTQQRVNSSDQLPESNGQRTAAEEANQQRIIGVNGGDNAQGWACIPCLPFHWDPC